MVAQLVSNCMGEIWNFAMNQSHEYASHDRLGLQGSDVHRNSHKQVRIFDAPIWHIGMDNANSLFQHAVHGISRFGG